VTITRIGSNATYASGWEVAFGKAKKAKSTKPAKSAKSAKKAAPSKKKTAPKKKTKK
jgi:hypothetical protein